MQIDEEREKDCVNDGKLSARTLSDILSISEFDEPDLIMRNADLRPQSFVSGHFMFTTNNDIKEQTATVIQETDEIIPIAGSSGILHHPLKESSPALQKEQSLPTINSAHKGDDEFSLLENFKLHRASLTSPRKPENASSVNFKALNENCSMFPNKDASGDKNVTIQPKRIDFSKENYSEQNKVEKSYVRKTNLSMNDADIYNNIEQNFVVNQSSFQLPRSLKDVGIKVDTQQKDFPDILTQLQNEICILRDELNAKTNALKLAEEQLSEFPIVKNGMEDLERVLQNSLETMQEDKKYFNIQLENFAKGEQILKEKLQNALSEVKERSKEINILKDDILRRETMISEIYKEKRSVEVKLSQVEEKCKILESNSMENHNLKMKLIELQKLENTIAEKNLQIDSLNENLDRLDDLQKRVTEEDEQNKKLSSHLLEKTSALTLLQKQYQDLKYASEQSNTENCKLTAEIQNLTGKNTNLQSTLSKFKDAVSKIESDVENVIQRDNNQIEPTPDPTNEDIIKLEEFKWLLSGLEGHRSPTENTGDDDANSQYQTKLEKIRLKVQTLQNDLISKRKELCSKVGLVILCVP